MKQSNPKEVVQPTSLQQVSFNDGMIVTAEDLQDATSYPLGVFKTLIRAFFGCGIVCGLKVDHSPVDEKGQSWCIEVKPGVALDCYGHPIELCRTVKLNLDEAYLCDPNPPECVYIAIRRYTTEESPRPNPSCSEEKGGQEYDCTRIREQVMIKVFDPGETSDRSSNICMTDPYNKGLSCVGAKVSGSGDGPANQDEEPSQEQSLQEFCDCIKACSGHECCGDAWVLLACIELGDKGVVCVENRLRKYVKPIQCLCPPEEKACVDENPGVISTAWSDEKKQENRTSGEKPAPKKRSARRKATPQKEG